MRNGKALANSEFMSKVKRDRSYRVVRPLQPWMLGLVMTFGALSLTGCAAGTHWIGLVFVWSLAAGLTMIPGCGRSSDSQVPSDGGNSGGGTGGGGVDAGVRADAGLAGDAKPAGNWMACCLDGRWSECNCPAVACNYTLNVRDCGNGFCAEAPGQPSENPAMCPTKADGGQDSREDTAVKDAA